MGSSSERPLPAAERARRWSVWLRAEMERTGKTVVQLQAVLGERQASAIPNWLAAQMAPGENSVVHVARALGADEITALRAAGYGEMAGIIQEIRDASPRPDLLTQADPIVALILEAGLDPRVRRELLEARGADLVRLEASALETQERMRVLVEERKLGLGRGRQRDDQLPPLPPRPVVE